MTAIGSLCTGYGGLDQAATAVLGGRVAWHADPDPDVTRLLTHHDPHVPNHGDITTVDWAQVDPVDVLTAGYPCPPFSVAGRRAGADDPRHLWPQVARAIRQLRPQQVVLENVAGHLTLGWDAVLADLHVAGYDAAWCIVRASDVGAPHRRARLFAIAWPATGASSTRRPIAVLDDGVWTEPDAGLFGAVPWTCLMPSTGTLTGGVIHATPAPSAPTSSVLLPTPHAGLARNGAQDPDIRRAGGHHVTLADAVMSLLPTSLNAITSLLPTPTATPYGRNQSQSSGAAIRPSLEGITDWGRYEPAIRRWERNFTGPAPAPTAQVTTCGPHRLAPAFVEWLMGLDKGHVTDVPNLSRAARLRILGNGVVPPQATQALRHLITTHTKRKAAA